MGQLLGRLLPEHLLLGSVNRSMIMLFSLIVFCTCKTHLSASCQVFCDSKKDVRKFVRFQVIEVSWDTGGTLVCPGTHVFRLSQDNYRGNLHCTTWEQSFVRTFSGCVVSNCLLARFNRGNRHVHNCLTVRNGVGQQIPRGFDRFFDECFAVGCVVLLFLVQRRTLVIHCTGLAKNVRRRCIFFHTRGEQIPPTGLCPAVLENTDGQQSDNVLVDDGAS